MESLYVSASGDDIHGTGAIDRPFKSIRKASEVAQPGTTVNIKAGNYPRDIITLAGSGAADRPITYRNHLNEIPKFFSNDPGEAALVVYARNCNISGLHISYSIHCGIVLWNTNSIQLSNCVVEKCHRGGIYIGGTAGKTNYNKIILRNNTITNTCLIRQKQFDDNSYPGAVVITKADGPLLERNIIHSNLGEGIILSNSINAMVTQNTLYDNVRAGIYLDNCGHSTLERNYIYGTGKTKFFTENLLRESRPIDATAPTAKKIPTEPNSSDKSAMPLPMAGIIIANEERDAFINTDTLIIQNNILTRYSYGILYDGSGKSSGLHNCFIVNNTFYRGYREAIRIIESQTPSTNNQILNNLFDHTRAYRPILAIDSENQAGFKFCYNGWSHPPSFGTGPHDVVGDSKLIQLNQHYDFADPAAQFKLKENSSMRDAGKYIPSVTMDFWGNPRTAPYCIGAHELHMDSHHYSAMMDSLAYKYPHHM